MTLPVYFGNQQVGTLSEAQIGLSFGYDARWVSRKSSFPVSISMPFGQPSDAAATSWFWNLLPEEEQLTTLGRLLQVSVTDIYGLLEKVGRETAGALSIGAPEGEGNYRPIGSAELGAALKALPTRPLLADDPEITMSLAGAQSKMTIAQFGDERFLPLSGAASTHIIKPASARLYATVENEAFCMKLCQAVGIETASTEIDQAGEVKYLLVTRYDRIPARNRKVRRRHQEDATQSLGLPPTQKYEARGGPSLHDIVRLIDTHAIRKLPDRLALLDRAIFNTAIHNTDAHAKNISFFVERNGIQLAPAYDLMTSLIYDNITSNMAMKIGGANRAPHTYRKHWHRFAEESGYSPTGVADRAATLAGQIADKAASVEAELLENPLAGRAALKQIRELVERNARTVAANAQRDPL